MAKLGQAEIEVVADTTKLRQEFEELSEMAQLLPARRSFSLGDAGVVASVLGFVGFLIEKFF